MKALDVPSHHHGDLRVTQRPERVAIVTGAGSERGVCFATARELGAQGMRIVLTSTTDRIFARRAFGAIAFLASEGALYITGQLITIDGGNSISEERGR